jgi:hypothetical protein
LDPATEEGDEAMTCFRLDLSTTESSLRFAPVTTSSHQVLRGLEEPQGEEGAGEEIMSQNDYHIILL